MRVLVIDIGGTHVKVLATGEKTSREFPSGPTLTPEQMVAGVKSVTADWKYDAVSIGYPGPVLHGRPVVEPRAITYGAVRGPALPWSPEAEARMARIPSFVRGVVIERVERYARETGRAEVTPELLAEVRRAMPIDFSKRRPFFLSESEGRGGDDA